MTTRPPRAGERVETTFDRSLQRWLRSDQTFGSLDAGLVVAAILTLVSREPLASLHATFLLLMVGSCFWRPWGFVARATLWIGIATAAMLVAVGLGEIQSSDLISLPLLGLMLGVVFVLQSRRRTIERTLTQVAEQDLLTRLPNRSHLLRRLDTALTNAAAAGTALAVVSLDIDGLKHVNERLGPSAGDALLIEIGERLRRCVRADDTVARVGGDEFMIVVATNAGMVPKIAERIAAAVEAPFAYGDGEIRVTASLGVALSEAPAVKMRDDLVRHADAAMHRVKAEGRAGFEVFAPVGLGVAA